MKFNTVSSVSLVPLHCVLELTSWEGTRCTLPIGYQVVAPPAKADFVYLNFGAMTQQQGYVPPEAFAGEAEVHEQIRARGPIEALASEQTQSAS